MVNLLPQCWKGGKMYVRLDVVTTLSTVQNEADMNPQEAVLKQISTRRGKLTLALNMFVPFRCGGCDYRADGTRITLLGGKWRTDAELKELRQELDAKSARQLAKLEATSDEELAKYSDDEVFTYLDA